MWHCSVRAAPEDRMLSDDEWAQIAHDVMDRTGLSRYGEDDDAVRWIAVRHADDHVHIVAMLARQDRRKPSVHNDRYRVRDACLAAEQRYRLRPTAPADRTAPRSPIPGREGEGRQPRPGRGPAADAAAACRDRCGLGAASGTGFFARLEEAGVLVRQRYSTRNPGEVTGYAVAMPGDTGPGRRPGLVRGRQARGRPDLAPAAPAVGRAGPPASARSR